MITNDREDEKDKARALVEYAMAFLKPEALQSVLKRREHEKLGESDTSKEVFDKQVEELFGKPISSSGLSGR